VIVLRRDSRLLRRLAIALTLSALVAPAPGCGGKQPTKSHKRQANATPKVDQLLAEARQAVGARDDDTADARFRAAYKAKPDIAILEEHIRFLLAADRVPAAVELSKAYAAEKPTDARAAHLHATTLISAGDYAAAAEVAGQALARDDNDPDAHEDKGRALVLAGKDAEGLEELRRAVQLAPENVEFLIELGNALHRSGKVDEAALQLRAAIKLSPEHARAHLVLGRILRDQGELEESQVFLTQASKLDPRDARPWFELGVLQNKTGDNLGAEASLAKAIELDATSSLYWYAYAEMLKINKKIDEALAAYEKAQTAKPPHPKAAAKRGLLLAENKRYGEAEVFLTAAVREDPQNPYNYLNLAVVLEMQKKYKLAREMYERFLAIAPKEDGDIPKAKAKVRALRNR